MGEEDILGTLVGVADRGTYNFFPSQTFCNCFRLISLFIFRKEPAFLFRVLGKEGDMNLLLAVSIHFFKLPFNYRSFLVDKAYA